MKTALILISIFCFFACHTETTHKKNIILLPNHNDTIIRLQTPIVTENKPQEDKYYTYFVIVADTSLNYFTLHKKMFELHRNFNIPIDTMGRYFNKDKNVIALPDNSEDEMYAGEYLPRRFPSSCKLPQK